MSSFCRLLTVLVVFGLVMSLGIPTASASYFWSTTTHDGQDNEYKDNSRANVVDLGTQGIVDTGDKVYGLLKFTDKIQPTSVELAPRIIALYGFENLSPVGNGNPNTILDVGAAGSGVGGLGQGDAYHLLNLGSTINGLLGGGTYTTDVDWVAAIDSTMGGTGAGSMVAVLSWLGGPDIFAPPLGPGPGAIAAILADDGVAGTVGGGFTIDLIAGKVATTDFMQIELGVSSIAAIAALEPSTEIADELGGLTVMATPSSPGQMSLLKKVGTTDQYGATGTADVFLTSNVQVADPGEGWFLQDNTNITLNTVPEPSTMVVWGLLMLAGVAFGVRRRLSC